MKPQFKIVNIDVSEVAPSELGRTFATKVAAVAYCKRAGFLTLARVQAFSGIFYAPLLIEWIEA